MRWKRRQDGDGGSDVRLRRLGAMTAIGAVMAFSACTPEDLQVWQDMHTPASSPAEIAVDAALSQLGVPYRYAASNPGVAFDCSGLTKWAWGQAGVSLPHSSRQQYDSVRHVSAGEARRGDLVFYYSPISHVGIYIGNGQMVHAPNSGSVVEVVSVNWGKVTGVGRPG